MAKGGDNPSPYVVVCMQETEMMVALLLDITSSLEELAMGIRGELNMTD
jgi:hypothetical protein